MSDEKTENVLSVDEDFEAEYENLVRRWKTTRRGMKYKDWAICENDARLFLSLYEVADASFEFWYRYDEGGYRYKKYCEENDVPVKHQTVVDACNYVFYKMAEPLFINKEFQKSINVYRGD